MDLGAVGWSLLAGAAVVLLVMTAAVARARQIGRVAVVDLGWAVGFVTIAVVTALLATALDAGDGWRRWLLVGLVVVWGGRLAWQVRDQAAPGDEDSRYQDVLGGTLPEVGMGTATRKVFGVQSVAQWTVALPVMVGVALEVTWLPAVVLGVVVWLGGLVVEAVGDAQMTAFKAEPKESRPNVMDRGLWGWTRHPNYFGDATVWWGLWLVGGLGSGWQAGLVTIVAPVAMTAFLIWVTGAKQLEKKMMKRDGYPDYAERTSLFVPLPPGSALARRAG